DLEGGKEKAVLPTEVGGPKYLAWSPDGKTLAVGGPGEVQLWDADKMQKRETLPTPRRSVHCLAWSADGKTLATGGDDALLRLWDVAARKPRHTLLAQEE